MQSKKPHFIHPFYTDRDGVPMYAIIPDDGTRGYNMGERWEVEQLRDSLTALLEDNTHDGEIDSHHEGLGWKWLTSREAQRLIQEVKGIELPISSITLACRNGEIKSAVKEGRDWRFPQVLFLGWYNRRPKPRAEPKAQGKQEWQLLEWYRGCPIEHRPGMQRRGYLSIYHNWYRDDGKIGSFVHHTLDAAHKHIDKLSAAFGERITLTEDEYNEYIRSA